MGYRHSGWRSNAAFRAGESWSRRSVRNQYITRGFDMVCSTDEGGLGRATRKKFGTRTGKRGSYLEVSGVSERRGLKFATECEDKDGGSGPMREHNRVAGSMLS